jgi:hypothetical protein
MMKTRLFLPLLLPLALLGLLSAACAPEAATRAPAELADAPTAIQASTTPQADLPSPTVEIAPTEAVAPTALPVATSRGPDLEATDPATVSLASGQLQLVEFFRFT